MKISYKIEDISNEANNITILSKFSVESVENLSVTLVPDKDISVDLTSFGLRGAQGIPGPSTEWQSVAW
jgi:hypothetical protein